MIPRLVLIRGAGDLASGVAHRLWQSGFDVVMLELPEPLVVRRAVSFATAVYEEQIEVESVKAELCLSPDQVGQYLTRKIIPVIVDPQGESLVKLKPAIVVDAIMAKRNIASILSDALLVIGLGPGFIAGQDVHAVIETKRGHELGRVLYEGAAAPDTAEPGDVAGHGKERLLRAPVNGIIKPLKDIGDLVKNGEVVAYVDQTEICSAIDGLVRGMLYPGLIVTTGMKVGDIDPRGAEVDYRSISDKARAIGGGVLEAIMHNFYYSHKPGGK